VEISCCSEACYSRKFSQDNYDGKCMVGVVVEVIWQCRVLPELFDVEK
jgi:hypothetical protein